MEVNMPLCTHKLRTPVTVIKGSIDLLLMGKFGTLNASQLEVLHLAEQGIANLLSVIDEMSIGAQARK